MAWRKNERGICPEEARGKRVKVRLRNGRTLGDKPISSSSAAGWRADKDSSGSGPPTRWTLTGDPFDVLEWDFA